MNRMGLPPPPPRHVSKGGDGAVTVVVVVVVVVEVVAVVVVVVVVVEVVAVVVVVLVVVLLLTTKSHTNRSHVSNIFHMTSNIFKNIFVFCKNRNFLLQKGTIKLTTSRLNNLHLTLQRFNL